MVADIYTRAWRRAFAGIVPQSYLDTMDVRSEASAWHTLLQQAQWPNAGALLAEVDRAPVAFAGFGPAAETPAIAELGTLYAVPGVWGTGVGRQLMAATMETLREAEYRHATLWVLQANSRARRFYEVAGWRPDGTIVDDMTAGVALPKMRYCRSVS